MDRVGIIHLTRPDLSQALGAGSITFANVVYFEEPTTSGHDQSLPLVLSIVYTTRRA
jgi:hypothetical protein